LELNEIMKNILLLSACLTLTACASGLPELKYADGSMRIPVNPKPIERQNTGQSTAVADVIKPSAAQVTVTVNATKPVTKHGCKRPQQNAQAVGFKDLDQFQNVGRKNQPEFDH
jgi:hypothetical protein